MPSLGPSRTSSAPPRVGGCWSAAFCFLPVGAGSSFSSPVGPTACHGPQSAPGVWPRTATLMSPTPSGSRQVTPTALYRAVDARTIVSVRGFARFGIDFSTSGMPGTAPFCTVTPAVGASKAPSDSWVTCGVMPAPPGALAAGFDQRIGTDCTVCRWRFDGSATAPPATSNGTATATPIRSFLVRRRYLLSIANRRRRNTMGDAMGGFAGQIGITVPSHFAALVDADPSLPWLTHYDDASGERTELSGATLANWVAKTANLLVDGLGLVPGDRAGTWLPPHWQTAAVLLGAWTAGLTVTYGEPTAAGADVQFASLAAVEAGAPEAMVDRF